MKVIDFNICFRSPELGEPDDFNRTVVRVNGKVFWPPRKVASNEWGIRLSQPADLNEIKDGDIVEITMPCGVLRGTAKAPRINQELFLKDCTFKGRANCFATAQSGFGQWRLLAKPIVVETSAWDAPLPYSLYESARRLAQELAFDPYEEGYRNRHRKAMTAFLEVAKVLRPEAFKPQWLSWWLR